MKQPKEFNLKKIEKIIDMCQSEYDKVRGYWKYSKSTATQVFLMETILKIFQIIKMNINKKENK